MILVPEEEYDYFAYGLKRGGHHAVINWILHHYESWLYCNNCLLWEGRLGVQYESDIRTRGKKPYSAKLISFEDRPNFSESSFESISKAKEKPQKNILILRDAYNTFASRFRKKRNPHIRNWGCTWINFDDISIWKRYALEFMGETNFMGEAIKINYNKWFEDENYRKEISKNFGEFTDAGLQDVTDFGMGSSFDHLGFDQRAQQMDVTRRWKEFYKDEEYIDCLSCDKEIEEINRAIFGFSIPKIHI